MMTSLPMSCPLIAALSPLARYHTAHHPLHAYCVLDLTQFLTLHLMYMDTLGDIHLTVCMC